MKFVTPEQMQAIDRYAIETLGIPSVALMENAGRGAADAVRALVPNGGAVVVCCGRGNNGGDGFVAARHLANYGVAVEIFLVTQGKSLSGDAKIHHDVAVAMGLPVTKVRTEADVATLARRLGRCDLIVDALLGTGTRGTVSGVMRDVIRAVNAAKAPAVAIDIPSGLCGETGAVLGEAVRAQVTVTFQLPKTGFQGPGALDHTGEVDVIDIGIPVQCCPPLEELTAS